MQKGMVLPPRMKVRPHAHLKPLRLLRVCLLICELLEGTQSIKGSLLPEVFKTDSPGLFEVEIFIVCMGLFLLSKCVLNANACIITRCLLVDMVFNGRPRLKNRDDT